MVFQLSWARDRELAPPFFSAFALYALPCLFPLDLCFSDLSNHSKFAVQERKRETEGNAIIPTQLGLDMVGGRWIQHRLCRGCIVQFPSAHLLGLTARVESVRDTLRASSGADCHAVDTATPHLKLLRSAVGYGAGFQAGRAPRSRFR